MAEAEGLQTSDFRLQTSDSWKRRDQRGQLGVGGWAMGAAIEGADERAAVIEEVERRDHGRAAERGEHVVADRDDAQPWRAGVKGADRVGAAAVVVFLVAAVVDAEDARVGQVLQRG